MERGGIRQEAVEVRHKASVLHTVMLSLTMAFTGGAFTLQWTDHERIWSQEVRVTVIEKTLWPKSNERKENEPTAYIEGILPSKIKTKPLEQ